MYGGDYASGIENSNTYSWLCLPWCETSNLSISSVSPTYTGTQVGYFYGTSSGSVLKADNATFSICTVSTTIVYKGRGLYFDSNGFLKG